MAGDRITVQPIYKGRRFAPITRAPKPAKTLLVQIFEGVYEPTEVEGETFPIVDIAKPAKVRLEDRTVDLIVSKLEAYTKAQEGGDGAVTTTPAKAPKAPKKADKPKAAKAPKAANKKQEAAAASNGEADEPTIVKIKMTEPQLASAAAVLKSIENDELFGRSAFEHLYIENGRLVVDSRVMHDLFGELKTRLTESVPEGVNAQVATNAWDRIAASVKPHGIGA